MICACDHRDCWFIFDASGEKKPDRCPDCGKRTVRPATGEEISWFFREHGKEKA